MKLLLIYPPFCIPSTMPYSIAYLKSFIDSNSKIETKCIDLNAKFHKLRFKDYYSKLKNKDYDKLFTEFNKESMLSYSKNNKLVLSNKKLELFDDMLNLILKEKPDYAAFSMVYNSQCFYTQALVEELYKKNIKILVGGPAVHHNILDKSTFLKNEYELLNYFNETSTIDFVIPDFKDFDKKDYLTRETIYPLRTSYSCYYKQCAFCTHFHQNKEYTEIPLDIIKQSILKNKMKNIYFFDDMISSKRLIELSKMLKPLNVKWWCQLKPTKDLIPIMKDLSNSGLKAVSWGIESGNQRILNLMKKGINVNDIELVIKESKKNNIKNLIYIIVGFPTETKEELLDSVKFIERNKDNIDLVSTSLFGLQKHSRVYNNPKEYGIKEIKEKSRTILDDKIEYTTISGLNHDELRVLKKKYAKRLHQADKIPKVYNYFKEQVILI